jgi:acetylglutamate kinase
MNDTNEIIAALTTDHPLVAPLSGKTIVVKLGGSTLGSDDTTLQDVVTLNRLGIRVVLVHGGGSTISHWLNKVGQKAQFVNGLRVTDPETMEVVTMVLAGKVNKELVAEINTAGGRAVGICGVDAGLLRGEVKDPALGLVGKVTAIDTVLLTNLLAAGCTPIVAPIALGQNGEMLNLNADTAAAEIAVALGASKLIFLTDVPGIRGEAGQALARLTSTEAKDLIASGVIGGGMIPKTQACLKAIECISAAHIIDGTTPRALICELFTKQTKGTTISDEV